MAGIETFAEGDRFIFRLKKQFFASPGRQWSNTYEAYATGPGTQADLVALLADLLNFERDLHLTTVEFLEGSVSTWEPDTHPYDPTRFYIEAFGGVAGLRALVGDMATREIAWWITRQVTVGRNGKLFYRGVLAEGDIRATAGDIQLFNPSAMADELSAAATAAGMDAYFIGGADVMRLALISRLSSGATSIRGLLGLESRGAIVCKFNHKWFNRVVVAA